MLKKYISIFPKVITNEFINSLPRKKLSEKDKYKWYSKFYYKDMPLLDKNLLKGLEVEEFTSNCFVKASDIINTSKEDIINSTTGYKQLEKGLFVGRTNIFMENIKIKHLDWWFNWHVLENLRYMIWCPVAHTGINAKDRNSHLDISKIDISVRNYGKTHYPSEGFDTKTSSKIKIEFLDPSKLGFTKEYRNKNDIGAMYIGNVSKKFLFFNIPINFFIHIAIEDDNGTHFISNYYYGYKKLKSNNFKKSLLTLKRKYALSLIRHNTIHSLIEYNNLKSILLELYEKEEGRIL